MDTPDAAKEALDVPAGDGILRPPRLDHLKGVGRVDDEELAIRAPWGIVPGSYPGGRAAILDLHLR